MIQRSYDSWVTLYTFYASIRASDQFISIEIKFDHCRLDSKYRLSIFFRTKSIIFQNVIEYN